MFQSTSTLSDERVLETKEPTVRGRKIPHILMWDSEQRLENVRPIREIGRAHV